jgi:GNAT superfamily N-acetyltransferase
MEANITIRNATSSDATVVASLLRKMMTDEMEFSGGYQISSDEKEWNKLNEIILKNINDENFIYKIAEEIEGKRPIIGVSEAKMINRAFLLQPTFVLHIHSLYVDPDYRKKGIGKSLMEAVISWGTERKCEELELDVFVNNDAQVLYKNLGFQPFEIKMVRRIS